MAAVSTLTLLLAITMRPCSLWADRMVTRFLPMAKRFATPRITTRIRQRPGYESDRFRLMLYDRKTGEKKDLMPDFGHWVGTYTWAGDSETIYFSAEHLRHSLIYAVGPISGGHPQVRTMVGGYNDDVIV